MGELEELAAKAMALIREVAGETDHGEFKARVLDGAIKGGYLEVEMSRPFGESGVQAMISLSLSVTALKLRRREARKALEGAIVEAMEVLFDDEVMEAINEHDREYDADPGAAGKAKTLH